MRHGPGGRPRKQSIQRLACVPRRRLKDSDEDFATEQCYVSKPMAKSGSSVSDSGGFRFGRFALDVRSRELRKDGLRIRLQDQPFDVLLMLLRQPGEVLTRDELPVPVVAGRNFCRFRARAERGRQAVAGRDWRQGRSAEIRGNPCTGAATDSLHQWSGLAQPPSSDLRVKPRLAVLPFGDLGGQENHA